MDYSNLSLAREILPVVSNIATELATTVISAPLVSVPLVLFGAHLAFFAAKLPSSAHGLKDKRSLDDVIYKVLKEVERACTVGS